MPRCWCFTLNNWIVDEYDGIVSSLTDKARYAIVGKEIGESGTPHLQGYVSLKKQSRFKGAKKVLNDRCHVEEAKGSEDSNFEYCSKDGDYIEIGTRSQQGKRSDLTKICDEIKDGASLKDIAEAYSATYCRNYRGIANF